MQRSSTPSLEDLASLYVLDSLKGFGPQKFKQLHQEKIAPADVCSNPKLLPNFGKRGADIADQLASDRRNRFEIARSRAEKQLDVARRLGAYVITYQSPLYPKTVFDSNNPVPVLYARGDTSVLKRGLIVACVGSRQIRPPYTEWHREFAIMAVREGFTVVSGFALGADTIGHRAALDAGGTTICVMPSGLDRPFPPENRSLWTELLETAGALFVSEFPFGTGAASLNLRKRNKLIVAFARGVLVSQSSDTGGAMNAFRFAMEQKKPIATFVADRSKDTSGNDLIEREAARVNGTAFHGNDNAAFKKWLRLLSSSI